MRSLRSLISGCLLFVATTSQADEPIPLPAAPLSHVTVDDLAVLGEALMDLEHYRDNVFLYSERREELLQAATYYVGATVDYVVEVQKVTPLEVIVRVRKAGRTRVALRHDCPPWFGDLRTVWYDGSAATRRINLFTKPVGLRIGSEIPYEMAHDLRRGQLLVVQGYIESSELALELFEPLAVIVVGGWSATGVLPTTDRSQLVPGRVSRSSAVPLPTARLR